MKIREGFTSQQEDRGISLGATEIISDDEEVEMTPRSKSKYDEVKRKAEEYAKKHHTPRFVASQLSEEEAAIHLQQCWRNNRA